MIDDHQTREFQETRHFPRMHLEHQLSSGRTRDFHRDFLDARTPKRFGAGDSFRSVATSRQPVNTRALCVLELDAWPVLSIGLRNFVSLISPSVLSHHSLLCRPPYLPMQCRENTRSMISVPISAPVTSPRLSIARSSALATSTSSAVPADAPCSTNRRASSTP